MRLTVCPSLHSEIVKHSVFQGRVFGHAGKVHQCYQWHCAPPLAVPGESGLAAFVMRKRIGDGFVLDAAELEGLKQWRRSGVAGRFPWRSSAETRSACRLYPGDERRDGGSGFAVRCAGWRLHEYKRQHLNALHILHTYLTPQGKPQYGFLSRAPTCLVRNPPPGYYLAKEIIRFICCLAKEIDSDPAVRDKLKVVYLEDYRVTLAELLMPAADISEQISLRRHRGERHRQYEADDERRADAGTPDGANGINDAVGAENVCSCSV